MTLTRFTPGGPERCVRQFDNYRIAGVDDTPFQELTDAFARTLQEDIGIVARVQEALRSGSVQYGTTMPVSETNIRAFSRLVWDRPEPLVDRGARAASAGIESRPIREFPHCTSARDTMRPARARAMIGRDQSKATSPKGVDMSTIHATERPAAGDVIVVGGHSVGGARTMGEILEIRGEAEHERYRIRWEDGHESIFHPADGEATFHHYSPHGASVEIMRSLREQNIAFEPRRHPRTQTAKDEARALHASADHVGKTLVIQAEHGRVRVVIPASERLSLSRLRDALGVGELRFANEKELAAVYPVFELGAVPPFGGPDGDQVVVDRRVAALESVIVEAGSHSDSVLLATADLVRITNATVADVIAD